MTTNIRGMSPRSVQRPESEKGWKRHGQNLVRVAKDRKSVEVKHAPRKRGGKRHA